MRINSGNLDQHFYVDTAPELESDAGQVVMDWANATSVRRWGRFVPKGSRQFTVAMQRFAEIEWLIELRGRLAITPRMRLRTNESPARLLQILGSWSDDGKSPATAYMIYVACREQPAIAIAPAGVYG